MAASLDGVMSLYDQIIEDGYEGIIVRHLEAPYEEKRSRWIMKLKPKKEDIYRIVGYKEEISIDGIPKGRLGAVICMGSDGNLFSAGSGLTDELRESLWSTRASLNDKYVRIAYQHITPEKKVPRFPIFMEVLDYERALEGDPSISELRSIKPRKS